MLWDLMDRCPVLIFLVSAFFVVIFAYICLLLVEEMFFVEETTTTLFFFLFLLFSFLFAPDVEVASRRPTRRNQVSRDEVKFSGVEYRKFIRKCQRKHDFHRESRLSTSIR